jgi:hypothetical protein
LRWDIWRSCSRSFKFSRPTRDDEPAGGREARQFCSLPGPRLPPRNPQAQRLRPRAPGRWQFVPRLGIPHRRKIPRCQPPFRPIQAAQVDLVQPQAPAQRRVIFAFTVFPRFHRSPMRI